MKRFSKAAALAATAALAAFLALPAGTAGGAVVPDQSYALASEGTLTIGAQSFPIPVGGTGFTGEWDDVTGEFTGTFEVGPDQIVDFPTPVGPATIDLETATSGFSANLDPATGQVDLTSNITVTLTIVVAILPNPIVCTLGPIPLAPSSANPGGSGFTPTDPANTWAFTVTDAGFDVPAATCDDPTITPIVNTELGVPTNDTAITLSFLSGAIAPPVPPPPPPPPPPPAPPAPPVVGGAQTGADAAAGGTELPRTGTSTPFLAATGLGLLLAGAWLVRAQTAMRRVHDA